MESVDLKLGQVLYEAGGPLSHVYFPTSSIVSLLNVMQNGASAEIAIVGNEGVVGVSLFMGGRSTPSRGVVQSAGKSYRLLARVLQDEFELLPVMHLLLRYTQALITQMAQTAVCNRHHSLDQQLCRWLLLSLDRLPGNELVMTQELMANMLGVRREAVTESARALQQAGLIKYARGHIVALNRPGLEARSCECYRAADVEQGEFDLDDPGADRTQLMEALDSLNDRYLPHAEASRRAIGSPHRPDHLVLSGVSSPSSVRVDEPPALRPVCSKSSALL